MASFSRHDVKKTMKSIRWPLRLTWTGMIAETLVQSFWPLLSLSLVVLALLMLGAQDSVSVELVWTGAVGAGLAWIAALVYGVRHFGMPTRSEAIARLDASLPGRPLQALLDTQTIGAEDAASTAVWRAHQARMAERAERAEPVSADLRVSSRDPFALRYMALLVFGVALLFGSIWRVGSVSELTPGAD